MLSTLSHFPPKTMFSARENRCHRFQANIFNKSKCQNCFKTVDSHKLGEADLFQSKPVQVGWLLLAPEDTDFSASGLRKRKWQRRYFVLYEQGLLRYSLDEMSGTLPHGSVNMTKCFEVLDVSSQTGFQNCLRLCFTDRDYYIRTESTDSFSISRWQENLIVYPKAAKSNQKKGKDPAHPPQQTTENLTSSSSSRSSAKKSSTSGNRFTSNVKRQGSISSNNNRSDQVSISDNAGTITSSATNGGSISVGSRTEGAIKNDRRGSVVSRVEEVSLLSSEKELEEESLSSGVGVPSSSGNASSLNTMLRSSLSSSLSQSSGCSDTDGTKNRLGTESGYSSLEKTSPRVVDAQAHTDSRRSRKADQQEGSFLNTEFPPITVTSSSTKQNDHKTTVITSQDSFPKDIPDHLQHFTSCSLRSLERRPLDPTPTPDLLNFKKGWMSRLGEDGKWQKHWFVLTDQTLRFYRDSAAEEAADVDGEINLSTCYDVTDYAAERNYGFQIHTKDGVFTLCAMTYGIRRNWVQAVMKNVRPSVAPDVTWKSPAIKSRFECVFMTMSACSIPQKLPMTCAHARTSSCQCSTVPQEAEQRSRIRERCREGRYKTFDWAELSCKQHKEELSDDLSGRQWNLNNECSVPPVPASSTEEQITHSAPEASKNEYLQKRRISQEQSLNIMSTDMPSHLSLIAVSTHTSSESISPGSLEVDAGTVHVHHDSPGELLEAKPKKEEQVDRSTSPLPVTTSSSSAQTEWQWDVELQSLRRELKAEHERNQTQEREFRLSEARLQAELNNSRECLQRAELKIQEAEALLKEREEVLENLRGRLEEVTGYLKATEEAQALKEVRLQRHLRLLQESQERERRSFSDSLDQSEQRSKELEEHLLQKEAELQKKPSGDITDELLRRCQELQNQLEESDSEVCRLQARLQTEETLYYDMEHDYERACEEIQSLRGALLDCERVSVERFQTQLVQQQRELDGKEQELQEVLLKMAILGSSLEETEQRLKEAQTHSSEGNVLCETLTEPQQCRQKAQSDLEMQPTTQGEESHRVISVIQALERKLCDTEERLLELTMHLQQQQQPNTGLHARLSVDSQPSFTGALHILEGTAFDRNSDKTKLSIYDDVKNGGQRMVGKSSGRNQTLEMASRVLSLEALIIQRIASALEHPSSKLLNRLSEVHVHMLRMAQGGNNDGPVETRYSQIFLDPLEQDLVDNTLSESAIHRLCERAEMTYLIHTLCTYPSQEPKESELFYDLPWPECSSSRTKMENCSNQGSRLADISPPELAPYSEQTEDKLVTDLLIEGSEVQLACRTSLVVELRAQAQSLQNLSTQLQSNVREADFPGDLPSAILRAATCQATLAYVACRLRSALQQEMSALRKQREQAECECRAVCRSMEAMFQEQTEHYEEKLREERVVVKKAEQERISAENNAQLREEAEKLQLEFEEKLQELQKIHEEEMSRLHEYHIQNLSKPKAATPTELEEGKETEQVSVTDLQDRIRELETEMACLRDLSNQDVKAFHLDLETIKATYEHGFSIMEESHQRVIEEMQRQHQREVERLTEERERVLQEETNATIAAIEAMRKAHKAEMDKTQKALQNGAGVDIRQLHAQYSEELETLHRELEVLSEQYSQKCLENTHLNRTVETEREALSTTQRENQELRIHNQELNELLAAELSLMHSHMNGEVKHSQSSQEKDMYQLEVNLRVKDSEIKCLKQEINSLKLELQAGNTYFKEQESEPGASEVKTKSDFAKLRMVAAGQQSLKSDLVKSRSNPDFLKDHAILLQHDRSKSLKDGLTVLERMKLFEISSTQ